MAEIKEDHISLSVYRSLEDGSWTAKKHINHNPVSGELDETDKELAIAICKAFAQVEGAIFQGPEYLFLPSGIYRKNGSGFDFVSQERDVGYTKLTERKTKLLLAYDCKTVWERILYRLKRKWQMLGYEARHRLVGAEKEGIVDPDVPATEMPVKTNED